MSHAERQLEEQFIENLRGLKYEYRQDIRDRAALEQNFRQKFQTLNHVRLTDSEFQRLLDEIVTPDVYANARVLRAINSFTRDDGTELNYTLQTDLKKLSPEYDPLNIACVFSPPAQEMAKDTDAKSAKNAWSLMASSLSIYSPPSISAGKPARRRN